LLDKLTMEPYYFAYQKPDGSIDPNAGPAGSIDLSVKRAHESELIIAIVIVGAKAFVTAAMAALGKYAAEWLISRANKFNAKKDPEVREALGTVAVSRSAEIGEAATKVSGLLNEVSLKKEPVAHLVVDPGFA
jgi:hypothetical protein